jgi:iron(III) transport system substrate-binding protein
MTREQQLIEAAKANGETEVVLWSISWYHGPVEQAFEAKYPFLKLKVWDGSNSVEPKVKEEYKAGRYTPDVLQLGLRRVVRLNEDGVLGEYEWPNVVGWQSQPDHGLWKIHQTSLRIPVYNTKLLSPAEAPKSWEDLADPKWEGKTIISTSGADYPLLHAYVLGDVTEAGINWDRSVDFWKKVVNTTKPQIGRGFKGPLEQVVTGDVSLMVMAAATTGLYNVRTGAPLEFVPVGNVAAGDWAIALTKNPPNPNAAQLLLDFLTSEAGALVHADMSPNPTYHPEASKRAYANQYFASRGIEWTNIPEGLVTDEDYVKASDIWVEEILGMKR